MAEIEDVTKLEMDEIVSLIVGRTLDEKYPARNHTIGGVLMEVEKLNVPRTIYDISFQVRRGEVLGFSGLVGSGRTSTAKALFGAIRKTSGTVRIDGKEVRLKNPCDAIRNGIGLLPENRKEEGLVLTQSISWNIVFAAIKKYVRRGFLNGRQETADVLEYKERLNIKAPDIHRQVKYLSGGNQQKVVFAKWLCAESDVYIFDEPTRGIDVGAKSEIYGIINMLVEKGNAVIVISSELPEILGICDRVLVFHEGRVTANIDRKDATQENLMYYMIGGN